jgi:hypothetical protein
MNDGGYLLGGVFGASGFQSLMPSLILTDSNGKVRWARLIGDGAYGQVSSVEISDSGAFFVTGEFLFGNSNVSAIIKFDSMGNTLWSKILYTQDSNGFNNVVPIAGGGCYFTGLFGAKIFALKFTGNGALEWGHTFSTIHGDSLGLIPESSTSMNDGSIIITGYEYSYLFLNIPTASFILNLAPDGTLAWHKKFDGASPISIISTSDGGFAICGETTSDFYAAKFESSGSLQWGETINASGTESARALVEKPNGDLVLVGSHTLLNDAGTVTINNLLITEIMPGGKIRSAVEVAIGGEELVVNGAVNGDKDNIVFTGLVHDSAADNWSGGALLSQLSDFRLACHIQGTFFSTEPLNTVTTDSGKLQISDLNAEDYPINLGDSLLFDESDLCALSSVTSPKPDLPDLSIHPDPLLSGTTVTITINSPFPSGYYTLSLRDLLGNEVHYEKIYLSNEKKDIIFDVSSYSSGMYFFELHNESQVIARQKFIKEN